MRNVLIICICILVFAATSAHGGCGQECDFIQPGCRLSPDPYLGCASFGGGCEEFDCGTAPQSKAGEKICPAMKWSALATAYGFDTAAERRGFYRQEGVAGLFGLVEDYQDKSTAEVDVAVLSMLDDEVVESGPWYEICLSSCHNNCANGDDCEEGDPYSCLIAGQWDICYEENPRCEPCHDRCDLWCLVLWPV